ncbi:PREDICTED: DNA ligase 4 isoform X1 [Lupinus angustifolius]|uniref:DNA ligase 4 isoform X1 n=1 Tax=Lupinus angustifolius TaxID=3871 RepID=UPI00092F9772|nr:PREDICTED: DNA ligase 4 isoform X1 [Lupinus angustifolius]
MTEQTKFSVLCSLFTWTQRTKSSFKKRSKFRKFLDSFCTDGNFFPAIRLILPNLDRERGTYGLKEHVLATCLIDALAISKDSDDAVRLINWRKGGAKTGSNVGNFALVATEVLQRRQGTASGGLTIKELNDLLDQLSSSENRAEKTLVFSTLIQKTNAQEMKWIIMIILKDLKLGFSEKSIFHEFHPDAEDLFNVTCDLKLVCEKLRDRNQRHKRQDIEVGKAVRPQLAKRVANATDAWKKLHGKEVVVECKFDGDRIQIHKNGTEIHYFSRNFLDHSEYAHAMSEIITQNIIVDRCILDGEMLVWDTFSNRFAEFGSNQEIAKAARDGLDGDRQLCYVAFDILYFGDTSVIHQTLKERHEILRKVLRPVKGRLEILIPNDGLNSHRSAGEPCWSFIAHNVDEVERFFKATIENRDEGIVVKDLSSKWEPSDRSGKWLKLKPEYVHPSSDLDVLVIGGYYGSGRHGGEVAQFLVGLAERPSPNTHPKRFVSFCRVGTGLSDDELDALVTKLKPYFSKYEYPKKRPPSFYQVTNHSKERPDVWVDSPEKSVILSITSDIRTIDSEVFAAPYSLRFPRIDRVRYDKPWSECLDVQSFIELVHSSNGTTQWNTGFGKEQDSEPKKMKSSTRGQKKILSIVPSHLIQTDVSNVKGGSLIFSNMMFYFVNVPPSYSLESLHKMVAENGGTFSMNLNNSVTHCVAADSKGFKFEAAKRHGDIIHCTWVLACYEQKKLVPLQPKYFLFLSEQTKNKLQEEIDQFSDSYYLDLSLKDMIQLLSNIHRPEDISTIDHYKKKYCPKDKWCFFYGCSIYFHTAIPSLKGDWEVLLGISLRRFRLEILMGGGKVTDNLTRATHLVVLSVPRYHTDIEEIQRSFTSVERKFLQSKKLNIVKSQWLEDCLDHGQRLPEETYSLKPLGTEESTDEDIEPDLALEAHMGEDNVTDQNISVSDKEVKQRTVKTAHGEGKAFMSQEKGGQRKRGRPPGRGSKNAKPAGNQAQRARPRTVRKRAKICEHESDENDSHDKKPCEEIDTAKGSVDFYRRHSEPQETEKHTTSEVSETRESLERNKEVMCEDLKDSEPRRMFVPEIEMTNNNNDQSSEVTDKLEILTDPVQSMLFDMIPSLATKKVEEPKNHNIGEEKPSEIINAEPSTTTKKKKVSYKDVVNDFLKDG